MEYSVTNPLDSFHNNLDIASNNKISVSSLRPQCLDSLRFPNSSAVEQSPKIHLLAFMSEFLEEKQDVKIEQIDQFCCYDRIKKMVQKKRMASTFDGSLKQKCFGSQQNKADDENLMKIIQIESKMKKMENNLMKYAREQGVESNINCMKQSDKSGQNIKYNSVSSSFREKRVKRNKQNNEFLENSGLEVKEKKNHMSQHLLGRYSIKQKLREDGYKQFMEWQKKKVTASQDDIKYFIQKEIQRKVDSILEQRDIKHNELLKQNKALQRKILQKNLQIQNLRSKQETLLSSIRDLQKYRDLFSEQSAAKSEETNKYYQTFHREFSEAFPNQSIISLKKQIETITNKCLSKFNDIQCKNIDKWNEQKKELSLEIRKLQNLIEKLKFTENQLRNNLKATKYEQSLASVEIDGLIKNKAELDRLQKKILSKYNEWYGSRSESEKELMKNLGYLQTNYEYEEMLDYIAVFRTKFSTDSKVNDYLIKVLRGIQRIRKILFPRNLESGQQKMDPLYILQKLEKYIKSKVYQTMFKKGNMGKGQRMSRKIEEQFLMLDQDEKQKQNCKQIN